MRKNIFNQNLSSPNYMPTVISYWHANYDICMNSSSVLCQTIKQYLVKIYRIFYVANSICLINFTVHSLFLPFLMMRRWSQQKITNSATDDWRREDANLGLNDIGGISKGKCRDKHRHRETDWSKKSNSCELAPCHRFGYVS